MIWAVSYCAVGDVIGAAREHKPSQQIAMSPSRLHSFSAVRPHSPVQWLWFLEPKGGGAAGSQSGPIGPIGGQFPTPRPVGGQEIFITITFRDLRRVVECLYMSLTV